ncbi:hypothetical protein CHS0354_023723 [Potamilus streckersoni]|uniref:Succinate--CoA ligase [ADP-forming] subunit beta, mitochondrial n=1 Tax=Potamilus streckersoni TaxID=2493646 RepID=A0AAE0RYQ6_9BIVA|nr:hypothetical protein CHS0354_023723 [Potamilus streckersoni]
MIFDTSSNSFGQHFKMMTFGESHGRFVGVVIDGVPPGQKIDLDIIQYELNRRKPGQSTVTTPRNESDKAEIVSGVLDGITTGTPLCILIKNQDQKSSDYEAISKMFRPGHASYTYIQKYGMFDFKGGGRASARETAVRVAAGAIAKQFLLSHHIQIFAFTRQVGHVISKCSASLVDPNIVESNIVRAPDLESADKMIELIHNVKEQGDSIGGIVEIVVKNLPAGLGEPLYHKLDADFASALMSLGAIKGFEIGDGFAVATKRGSENNDAFFMDEKKEFHTKTNHAGGVLGGISNGEDIIMKIAVKPPSSITKEILTANQDGEQVSFGIKGRHDPCLCPRVVPVAEAMVALIHEHQAKEILFNSGIAVPMGYVVHSPEEVGHIAYERFFSRSAHIIVLKAQIHAGGRGKAGGVKIVYSADEAYQVAKSIFGLPLVTHQTGPQGRIVRRFLLEQSVNIDKEFYVGITLDRSISKNVLMVSTEGGVEIEKIAEESPNKILKIPINPAYGLMAFEAREAAFFLGLSGKAFKQAVDFIQLLVKAYHKIDATLVEINPSVLTKEEDIIALDAKIDLDDNALFRHPEFMEMRDETEEDPLEVEATKSNLNYVKLDGNVGCMVNGAGLAMGTMDIIKLSGAEPANFLDVGGGANAKTVESGFRIILSDKNVKAILVNIFGGIVRCDRVASGIIEAAKNINLSVPVVVRLEGTNAEIAQKMLNDAGLNLISAKGLSDAADKIAKVIA